MQPLETRQTPRFSTIFVAAQRWVWRWRVAALLGPDSPNLSLAAIIRLTGQWEQDYGRWQRRDLWGRRYVYVWADDVYLQARTEPAAECMLVLIGIASEVKKELVGY